MIFLLMRADSLWRMSLAFAIVILILLALCPANLPPGNVLMGGAFGMCGILLPRFRQSRATLFEIALPIPARRLFLARLLSVLALVWLPAVTALAVIMLRWGTSSSLVPAVSGFAAIATLAALLPLSVRLPEITLPGWLTVALWAGVAGAGRAAWDLLPAEAILLLFGAASAALFLRTWSVIPPSFQVAPLRASRAAAFPALPGVLPLAWRPVLRSVRPWLAIVNLFMMAMLTPSGGFFFFLAMWSIQMHAQCRNRLRWLSTLAVSPRSLLLITLAASVAPIAAGVVLGASLGSRHPLNIEEYVGIGPKIGSIVPEVSVPLEFWRRAPGGRAPVIRAPWGETAQPSTISILGIAFYNPYSAGPGHASHRFIEWQWERATQALHGRRIPFSQYYAARKAGLPAVTHETRFRILCMSALLVFSLYLVFLGEFSRWHRLRRPSQSARRILLCGLLGLPVLAMYAADMFYIYRYATPVAIPLIKAVLLHAVRLLPNSLLLVTAVAAVPVLAMYWLLEWQFRQSELLGPLVRPEVSCSTN